MTDANQQQGESDEVEEKSDVHLLTDSTLLGPGRSIHDLLHRILGGDGLESLKNRNWTSTGAFLLALGVIADLSSIFGNISLWGLILSTVLTVGLAVVVILRLRGCSYCATPFVSSSLLMAMFLVIVFVQSVANAGSEGIVAKAFPGAAKIQLAIYEKLTAVEASQERIEAKLDRMLEEFRRAVPDADPATVEAFRVAAETLAASGDARKRKALEDYADGRVDSAILDLTRLAEDQTTTTRENAEQAAQTWKEVGALAFLSDTDSALRAYRAAVELTSNDPVARNQLGYLLVRIGDLAGAATQYTHILEGPGVRNMEWEAAALNNLGTIELTRGHLDAAEDHLLRSLALYEELGRLEGMASLLGNLGNIEYSRGNLDAAEDYYRRGLALNEELGRPVGMANQLNNLGNIERTHGNLDAAEDHFRRSLALHEELGRPEGMATPLGNLGLIEQTRGNLDAAEDYYRRSLVLYEELGHSEGMASQLGSLGVIEYRRGHLDAAEDYHRRSLALYEEIGRSEGMANQLGDLGNIEYSRGNLDAAEDHLLRSLALNEELGRPVGMANQLNNLAGIEISRGNLDVAEDYYRRSLALNEELGRPEGMAMQLHNLGIIERKRGNLEAACSSWSRVLTRFADSAGAATQVSGTQTQIDKYCTEGP